MPYSVTCWHLSMSELLNNRKDNKMHEEVVAVFIPIVMFLIIGLIWVTYIYYRSRERQMLIEKGLSAEDMKKFFEQKKDPFWLMKVGIICIFFGIGLGIGLMSGAEETREVVTPTSIFIFTGIGFVIANIYGNKMRRAYDLEKKAANQN
jgi:predicted histidine transporter YuiF (NhaC family)